MCSTLQIALGRPSSNCDKWEGEGHGCSHLNDSVGWKYYNWLKVKCFKNLSPLYIFSPDMASLMLSCNVQQKSPTKEIICKTGEWFLVLQSEVQLMEIKPNH